MREKSEESICRLKHLLSQQSVHAVFKLTYIKEIQDLHSIVYLVELEKPSRKERSFRMKLKYSGYLQVFKRISDLSLSMQTIENIKYEKERLQ